MEKTKTQAESASEPDEVGNGIEEVVYLARRIYSEVSECGDSRTAGFPQIGVATVAEWYRYRIVACFVTSLTPVSLKTRCVGQRCTLNLSRAEMSSRWCGVIVRRGGASSGVIHVT
ncbi:UNVERIFIED_CONTAM: hypothetical protein NCL1_08374 [Trichonephila clavipes]